MAAVSVIAIGSQDHQGFASETPLRTRMTRSQSALMLLTMSIQFSRGPVAGPGALRPCWDLPAAICSAVSQKREKVKVDRKDIVYAPRELPVLRRLQREASSFVFVSDGCRSRLLRQ
jgi:hypothetical protein